MFEELLDDYETQLELFEEVALRQFEKLEIGVFAQFQDCERRGPENGEARPVIELVETSFSVLNEHAFAELNLARRH